MGMDMFIDRVKHNPNNKLEVIKREEICYWRKFWDLHYAMPFKYGDEEYCKDVPLTKDDVKLVLEFVTHNRDYFDSFKSVESVCELLDQYDSFKADGWDIVYNANW